MDSNSDRFVKLEQNLEELIENMRQTSIIASDFQPQGKWSSCLFPRSIDVFIEIVGNVVPTMEQFMGPKLQ